MLILKLLVAIVIVKWNIFILQNIFLWRQDIPRSGEECRDVTWHLVTPQLPLLRDISSPATTTAHHPPLSRHNVLTDRLETGRTEGGRETIQSNLFGSKAETPICFIDFSHSFVQTVTVAGNVHWIGRFFVRVKIPRLIQVFHHFLCSLYCLYFAWVQLAKYFVSTRIKHLISVKDFVMTGWDESLEAGVFACLIVAKT